MLLSMTVFFLRFFFFLSFTLAFSLFGFACFSDRIFIRKVSLVTLFLAMAA